MKNTFSRLMLAAVLVLSLAAVVFSPALAQTPEAPVYTMGLSRDFGYGAGSQIRGLFTARVAGPAGYTKVVYYIDGQVMAEKTTSPFTFQFNTSSYPTGTHILTAEVTAADGTVYTTPARNLQFVSQQQESEGTMKILIPILGLVVGVMLLVVLIQMVAFRRKGGQGIPMGAERNYGVTGGAICPRCHRPTPIHFWSLKLGFGRFDYCEACGKWSIMRRVPIEILRTAEEAEKAQSKGENAEPLVKEPTEEEKLREMIEKSKYEEK